MIVFAGARPSNGSPPNLSTGRKSTGYPAAAGFHRPDDPAGAERTCCYGWAQAFGPIAVDVLVIHRCSHKACCEVRHLALGDRADLLAVEATRTPTGRRKMPTPADVAQIRLRWASGDLTQAAIGALFDVNQGAVSNSVNYRSHVAVPCVQVVAELVEPAVAARPVGASRLLPAGSLALPPVR